MWKLRNVWKFLPLYKNTNIMSLYGIHTQTNLEIGNMQRKNPKRWTMLNQSCVLGVWYISSSRFPLLNFLMLTKKGK